jgi:hypothetical protein
MHGLELEQQLDYELTASLGVTLIKNDELDWFGAIDSRVTALKPHGEKCTCPSYETEIFLQYTLQEDAARKLERFYELAKTRGGKHLYTVVGLKGRRNPPWLRLIAKMIGNALLELALAKTENAIKVLKVEVKGDYLCRLCNQDTEICNCRETLTRDGLADDKISSQLARFTRIECDYQARLVDAEQALNELQAIRNEHETNSARITGVIDWASFNRGRIKTWKYVPGVAKEEVRKELYQFIIDDVKDPELRQLIRNLNRMKKSELLNDLKVTFEPSSGADSLLEAVWIYQVRDEKFKELKRLVWEKHRGQKLKDRRPETQVDKKTETASPA